MKQTLVVAFALLLGACSSVTQTTQPAPRKRTGRPAFEIRSLLKTLNKALEESQGHNPAGFPNLKSVEVQLQATTEMDASGQVKFLIVTGGVDTTMAHTTSLTMDLEAPQTTSSAPTAELRRVKLKSPIAQAILAAQQAYLGEQQATSGPLGSFERGDITVEIAFEISDKATASIETGDLLPVGLNASAGVTSGKTHNIKLVYGNR